MSLFDPAFAIIVGEEGRLSRDPHDDGNWTGGRAGVGMMRGTKYGISAAAFPALDIEALTLEQAKVIYRERYWDALELDTQPWGIALLKFDAAVNNGQNWAKTLPNDRQKIAIARAMRYASSEKFKLYGEGWFTRLFDIYQKSQSTPT